MLVAAAALIAAVVPAGAAQVRAELVSSRRAVRAGEWFDAGLKLTIPAGWHVYWRNPGDSGLPTKLKWSLPDGWRAGALEWPAPKRFQDEDSATFGYEGSVIHPVRLGAPVGAAPGEAVLSAQASWLECADICVPGKAALELRVLVAAKPESDPSGVFELGKARAAVPRPDRAAGRATWDGKALRLLIPGRHPDADFFPTTPDAVSHRRPPVELVPGGTELTLAPGPGRRLERIDGVLVRPGLGASEISVPVKLPFTPQPKVNP